MLLPVGQAWTRNEEPEEAAATGAFFNKWTRDFADSTGASTLNTTTVMPLCSTPGACWVPNTAPTVSGGGGPAWSGFVVTNPWQTYNTWPSQEGGQLTVRD